MRAREVTTLELVDAAIARIEMLNPRINAVVTPMFESARRQARGGGFGDGPFALESGEHLTPAFGHPSPRRGEGSVSEIVLDDELLLAG